MNGFTKWLSSTKFQIAVLSIGLIYLQQEWYGLSATVAADCIMKLAIAYFGARIIEPVVEFIVKKLNGVNLGK